MPDTASPQPPATGNWPAPTADRPVRARLSLPGSKSVTNRALVLATLSETPCVVRRPLASRDSDLMAGALRALGARVEWDGDDLLLTPADLRGPATVDVGNAGTVMRFVPPMAALTDGDVQFDGDPRSHERPVGALLGALRALGAGIDDGGRGALPLTVHGTGSLPGGEVTLDASGSSQFVSALLLSAARFDKGLRLRHDGPPVPSQPHVDMTVEMLRAAGVGVETGENEWRVEPGPIRATEIPVEPDLSNAAPFLAAALVTGGAITVADWPEHTTQAGDALRSLLARMGGEVGREGTDLTVYGTGKIRGLEADLHDVGELTPPSPHSPPWPTPLAPDRHRPPAAPRDRPDRGTGRGDQRARRARGGARGRPGHRAAAAARGCVPLLRRPQDGHFGGRARTGGPRDRGGGHRHDR